MIQGIQVAAAHATNSVANTTGIDLLDEARIAAGPVFPNTGNGNAVALFNIVPGATPGTYVIVLAESDDNVTYTNITNASITQANAGTVLVRNITIRKRYIRLEVEDATANAGTVDCVLLSS